MVITTRFKEEPVVTCMEEGCKSLPPQSTRSRARQHAATTGHAVRVIVEDVTYYRKGQ